MIYLIDKRLKKCFVGLFVFLIGIVSTSHSLMATGKNGKIYAYFQYSSYPTLVSMNFDEDLLDEGSKNFGLGIRYRRSYADSKFIGEFFTELRRIGKNVSYVTGATFMDKNHLVIMGIPLRGKNYFGKKWRWYISALELGFGLYSLDMITKSNDFSKKTSFGIMAAEKLLSLRHNNISVDLIKLEFFVTTAGIGGASFCSSVGISF